MSFGGNFHHWLHQKLSFWQFSMQSMKKNHQMAFSSVWFRSLTWVTNRTNNFNFLSDRDISIILKTRTHIIRMLHHVFGKAAILGEACRLHLVTQRLPAVTAEVTASTSGVQEWGADSVPHLDASHVGTQLHYTTHTWNIYTMLIVA